MGVKAFGIQLRRLRESQNLSQQELADLADLAKITIQRIENAKFSVTFDVLISLARALNLPVKELTDVTIPKEKGK
jgi:transcriptional regulator with XRE-family HTH domain